MKCRICGQAIDESQDADHHLRVSPIDLGLCLGCWMFTVEAELFLLRAGVRAPMGNWTEGWLNAIIADPRKFL